MRGSKSFLEAKINKKVVKKNFVFRGDQELTLQDKVKDYFIFFIDISHFCMSRLAAFSGKLEGDMKKVKRRK